MKPKTYVIFQTVLEGKLAQTEIEADPSALYSREKRFDAERQARLAFSRLSPSWDPKQRIKAVDILTIADQEPEPEPDKTQWSDVAFTCDYCGNKWNDKYPAAGIVHKTLSGCRRCLIKLSGPGEQVRYTAGREIRHGDYRTADKALRRGNCYVVEAAYKAKRQAGIKIKLIGIVGLFDFQLFVPAEFGRNEK